RQHRARPVGGAGAVRRGQSGSAARRLPSRQGRKRFLVRTKAMTQKILLAVFANLALGLIVQAQDVVIKIVGGAKPSIAVPDFRGAGDSAKFMNVFNQTLFSDIESSGLFK